MMGVKEQSVFPASASRSFVSGFRNNGLGGFEINAGCRWRRVVPGLRLSGRAALIGSLTEVGAFHATSCLSGLYGSSES